MPYAKQTLRYKQFHLDLPYQVLELLDRRMKRSWTKLDHESKHNEEEIDRIAAVSDDRLHEVREV